MADLSEDELELVRLLRPVSSARLSSIAEDEKRRLPHVMQRAIWTAVLERLAQAEAEVARLSAERPDLPGAVRGWVTSGGTTEIPPRVMVRIGLPTGGGVFWVEQEDETAVVLSDATFGERYLGDDKAPKGES